MRLDLSKVRAPNEHFEFVFDAGRFPAEPESFRVVAPVALTFDLVKDKEQFRLAGTVKTTLEVPCSRCLEPFELPVDAPFDLRYQPQALAANAVDREIADDDLSTSFYVDEEIDLSQLIGEQLYLAMPMKPLCRGECQGLCPECGTNLNRGTCSCTRDWTDPRLAVLKSFKSES